MSCIYYRSNLPVDGSLTGKYIVSITLVAKFRIIIQSIHFYLWKDCIVGDLRLTQDVSSNCNFTRAHDIHCKVKGIDKYVTLKHYSHSLDTSLEYP